MEQTNSQSDLVTTKTKKMEKDRIKISEITDCISGWEEVLGYEMLVDLMLSSTLICRAHLESIFAVITF